MSGVIMTSMRGSIVEMCLARHMHVEGILTGVLDSSWCHHIQLYNERDNPRLVAII